MSDNKVIRTTVLDLAGYLPANTKFIVQTATGTFKASWQTITSALTSSIADSIPPTSPPTTPPPTTPASTGVTTPPPSTPPPTTGAPLYIYFLSTGNSAATINTGGSATVVVVYDYPGEPTDYIDFFVDPPSAATATQWSNNQPAPAVDSLGTSAAYSSSSSAWEGAGVYTFYCAARRTSTNLFDVISNTITLTVTA